MKRLLYLLPLLLLVSCQTVPEQIPEDLSQAELIQLAQEASEAENWAASRAYYQAIVERFSQDREALAVARYEIGFVEYKSGNFDAAEQQFATLLGMYDFESSQLPAWPRVLAGVILDRIEEERAEQAQAVSAEEATGEE
jgi:outer membrane protein assembly factor BamD (BamD/ComL family)